MPRTPPSRRPRAPDPDDVVHESRAEIVAAVEAIRRILRGLRVSAQEVGATTGVSAAQLFVLRVLDDLAHDASLSDLAHQTMTDRSSVSAVVDRLLQAGLVTRGTSAADRRRAAVAITAGGRDLLRRAPQHPTARLISALETIAPAQRRDLAGQLARLADAMGMDEGRTSFLFEDAPVRARRG